MITGGMRCPRRYSAELKQQRVDWLSQFPSLYQDILNAVNR